MEFLGGSLLAEYDQGAFIIQILNHIQIDFRRYGNHEFDTGTACIEAKNDREPLYMAGSNVKEQRQPNPDERGDRSYWEPP